MQRFVFWSKICGIERRFLFDLFLYSFAKSTIVKKFLSGIMHQDVTPTHVDVA